MILITGGLGFIGSHTARAVLDLGEPCVVAQRRDPAGLPPMLAGEAGGRLFAERADLTDASALVEVGKRHNVTGIIHLAGSVPWPPGAYEPVEGATTALGTLLNVFAAARDLGVARVTVASTIGVYGGVTQDPPYTEDLPLPMTADHVIPAFKKIGELLGAYTAKETGIEIVSCRIGAIWGPLGRPGSPFIPVAQLVHAAVRGTEPDLSTLYWPAHAGDGTDLCYAKDCGRALALLQLADMLRHQTYNVAAGRVTTYGEITGAIAEIIPGARVTLPPGRNPHGPKKDTWLDITRLREDTGYQPEYGTHEAVADYIGWLRAGNEH
jgi:UDP-glucose 4-epimerase